jgi:hypothetical protein
MPNRAEIVRQMFEDCANGIGCGKIAQLLTSADSPHWRKKNGWQPSYIKKILRNPAVIGVFQPHKLIARQRIPDGPAIDDYFPPAIDSNLFFRAQAALSSRATGVGGRKGATLPNLVAGIAFCMTCQGPMHYINKGSHGKKGGQYLQCDGARRRTGCDSKTVFSYQIVEEAIVSTMPATDLESILDAENAELALLKEKVGVVDGRLDRAKVKQKNLLKCIDMSETIDVDDPLTEQIVKLRQEIGWLLAERNRLNDAVQLASASSASDGADLVERGLSYLHAVNAIENLDERFRARSAFAQKLRMLISRVDFGKWSPERNNTVERFVEISFRDNREGMLFLDPVPWFVNYQEYEKEMKLEKFGTEQYEADLAGIIATSYYTRLKNVQSANNPEARMTALLSI